MAIVQGYPTQSATSVFGYADEFYRANTAGTGFADGDVIRRTAQIDPATGLETSIVNYYNVTQDAAITTVPNAADIDPLGGFREVLTSETITIDATAGGVALTTIPATANHAEIHVLDNDIILTLDGTTVPVGNGSATPIGFRQANGQFFELESRTELVNFLGMRLASAGDGRIYVQYYRVFGNSND